MVTDADGAFVRDTDDDAAIDRDILDEIVTDGVADGIKMVDAKK